MDEFTIRHEIVKLTYDLLKVDPDNFAKITDDVVVYFLPLRTNLNIYPDGNEFRGIEIKISRSFASNSAFYKLFIRSSFFDYYISDLDDKTAYKFFETDKQIQRQQEDFETIRDLLLQKTGKQ